MSYSDFTIAKVQKTFNLVIKENQELFTEVTLIQPSSLLKEFLDKNANLALKINTEKARSEMIAAQIFNEQENNQIPIILGVVTSGNIWKFLQLEGQEIRIDINEYYLKDIPQILGILGTCF